MCRRKIGDTDVQVRIGTLSVIAIHRAFSYARESLWQLCVGDLRICRFADCRSCTPIHSCHLIRSASEGVLAP